jgi:hypothetical protein
LVEVDNSFNSGSKTRVGLPGSLAGGVASPADKIGDVDIGFVRVFGGEDRMDGEGGVFFVITKRGLGFLDWRAGGRRGRRGGGRTGSGRKRGRRGGTRAARRATRTARFAADRRWKGGRDGR